MDKSEILKHVDHSLLSPTATWDDILALCKEAITHQTASVCIAPAYVAKVAETFGEQLTICTVIGFPLGYMSTAAKLCEAEIALNEGATELDLVINLGDVKNGHFDKVQAEITAIKALCGARILKVIIETCYLTEDEKIKLCTLITDAGADFIKTSTGFGTAGASFADIKLFQTHIGNQVQIKASGGISSVEDMVSYLKLGVTRIGSSSAIKLLAGENNLGAY